MTLVAAWLWQGSAIAAATAMLLARRRPFGAATRHAMWWTALAAVLLLPLAYLVPASRLAGEPAIVADLPIAGAAVPLPAVPEWLVLLVLGAWAAVALTGLARIAASIVSVQRLKVASQRLEPARLARLRVSNAVRHRRRAAAEIRVSSAVRGACAVGLGRPVILLSPAVLALDDERLDAIVMHEQAHLARFDDWTQLLQAVLSAVFALHPAVWFIGRHIDVEREAACDDLVLAGGAAPREYARSLVAVAEVTRPRRWDAVAIPGAVRSPSVLRRRVTRLLDASWPRDRALRVRATAACAAVMALAVGISAQTPSVVEFIDSRVAAPPVASLSRLARTVIAPRLDRVDVARQGARPSSLPPAVPPQPAVGTTARPIALLDPAPAPVVPAGELTALAPLPSASRRLPETLVVVTPAPPVAGGVSTSPADSASPWGTIARSVSTAGKATGSGARTAGLSVGRFFGRAGQAIAGSF